jgi:hypothetical protein
MPPFVLRLAGEPMRKNVMKRLTEQNIQAWSMMQTIAAVLARKKMAGVRRVGAGEGEAAATALSARATITDDKMESITAAPATTA